MATGLPAEGTCQLWWARTAPPDDRDLLALLADGERRRHAEFTDRGGRAAHLTARALTRLVLAGMLGVPASGLRFEAVCRGCGGPHGKPVLRSPPSPVTFSVSHSGQWCVVAFATGTEVGVDIERLALRGTRLPLRALAATERAVLTGTGVRDRTAAFVRYWTRKEALLKATGDGLTIDPAALTVTGPDQPAALLSWDAVPAPTETPHLVDLAAPTGYGGALATLGRALVVSYHDGGSLLDQIRTGAAVPERHTFPIRC
ncbi:4'-phosphopantetheinyl transferase [Micromonospora phaseoli]|uniref:4'-phosphopantetheinyl transferase n=1 Tax=Micromonospora phaseoli TaxID=1144548 RepID=A0A1H6YB15_9ACTN|nr:4'-phosphopantetheinyl transferase superfamily protein [Micromonospora phaseoli]PZW00112.1 4'-phosphopantetheinyl transferase [Micromonospora phaseoli]GIJ79622.1 4'-phosphopantetheinyl transferase [Micromonospora phaseoli]SEJ38439.1 4'-phosphopantetheinyl transferase [Micromonospora phaseoli]